MEVKYMANIPVFDPKDSEVVSPLIAGLTEGLNRLSEVLNLNTSENTDVQLDSLIWTDDKGNSVVGKMYQAPFGKKLWLQTPAPIIKKNGNQIKPQTDHFTIDYIGGGLFFEDDYVLQSSDIVTADFTQVKSESAVIYSILQDISDLQTKAAHDKGWFATYEDLISSYPAGVDGDHVIIGDTDTVWVWDTETGSWRDSHKGVDLSNYYTIGQVDNLLNGKEPTINKHGEEISSDNYYYGGRKQWIDLFYKIRNTLLEGFSVPSGEINDVSEADTLIAAIGKLQGLINLNKQALINKVDTSVFNAFKTSQEQINTNQSNTNTSFQNSITQLGNKANKPNQGVFTVSTNTSIPIPGLTATMTVDVLYTNESYNLLKENGNSYVAIKNENGVAKPISDKDLPANLQLSLRWQETVGD